MGYAFGQALTVWFFPLVDNEPAVIPDALQSQSPAIHVFSERPSRSDAASGVGQVGATITAWTYDPASQGFSFTVPAILDPDVESETRTENYFLAINFQLTALAQVQTVIQHLPMERVRSVARDVAVTENDLRAIYAPVDGVGTSAQRIAKISEAKRLVKIYFASQAYEWSRVHNLQDLNSAVVYKALSLIMLEQSLGQGDKFYVKYVEYKEIAAGLLASLQLEYDATDDGEPDVTANSSGTIFFVR